MSKVMWVRRPLVDVLTVVLVALLGMASLTACNTLRGAGQDVENAGDAVKDAVD
jgi:predicted small secreted protein